MKLKTGTAKSKGQKKDSKRPQKNTKSQSPHASSKRKKSNKGPRVIPVPDGADSTDDEDHFVDEQDLEFVKSAQKNELAFLESLPIKDLDKAVSQARKKIDKGKIPQQNKTKDLTNTKKRKTSPNASSSSDDDELPSSSDNDIDMDEGDNNSESEEEDDVSDSENDDEVETYEKRPRQISKSAPKNAQPERAAPLPVKTLDGTLIKDPSKLALEDTLRNVANIPGIVIHDDLTSALEKERKVQVERAARRKEEQQARKQKEQQQQQEAEEAELQKQQHEDGDDDENTLHELAAYQSIEDRRSAAKRSMAVLGQSILADPETQLGKKLRSLLSMLGDGDVAVRRLAMLSLLVIFKDLIPGYRIRSHEEELEGPQMISKEVRKLWEYEANLLKGYQTYLKSLLSAAKSGKESKVAKATARVAVRCMCTLLSTAPHFNYTSDLLQALVPNMVQKDEQIRQLCCGAIAELGERGLAGSTDAGAATVEAVQLVADLIKKRNCVAPADVVESLLGLSFPEITSGEDFEEAKRSRKAIKKKKKKKDKDEVSRAFKEAQAVADLDSRRLHQSSTLEALFEIFFRVLKTCTSSGLLLPANHQQNKAVGGQKAESTINNNSNRSIDALTVLSASRFASRFPLLAPSLAGLSKFAHLISIDYFGDLMAVLEELLESPALPPAVRLRCLLTAAEILKGQGESLNVDRRGFYVCLYSALDAVSLVPLNETEPAFDIADYGDENPPTEERLDRENEVFADQQKKMQTANSEIPTLLSRLLDLMILDSKLLDASRQAAFAKRIAIAASTAGNTGTGMGLLCVLQRMIRRQPKLRSMLENEAGGPSAYKTYRPENEDPAEAGALSTALWELPLLTRHFHPHISRVSADISSPPLHNNNNASSGGTAASVGGSSLLPLGTSPSDLARQYTTALGVFKPPPQIPKHLLSAGSSSSSSKNNKSRKTSLAGMKFSEEDIAGIEDVLLEALGAVVHHGKKQENEEESDDDEIEVAVKKYFNANKRFSENVRLRREHTLLNRQLEAFNAHMAEQQQKEVEKQKEKPRKKQKKRA